MKERGNRNQLLISSKLGFDYPGSDGGLTAQEIEREIQKSLEAGEVVKLSHKKRR